MSNKPIPVRGVIAVDLDGTLAQFDLKMWREYRFDYIGNPVPKMLNRVKKWLSEGEAVAILTARAFNPGSIPIIQAWLDKWGIGSIFEITCIKKPYFREIWDDKAIQVVPNKGTTLYEEFKQIYQEMLKHLRKWHE